MSERDIRGMMASLPAPEDAADAAIFKLVEMALIDLNRLADANEAIAKTLSFLADLMGRKPA